MIKNDRLEEVRGYKDEVVVERWGIVYNEDDIPVGLKPLPVKEVIPQSILDKMKFWRKPKPLTQILSIDFIGLIQYIGMINKIKKVVTIEEILEILNIKKVDVIGEITTIRDITLSPKSFIMNHRFSQGKVGWLIAGGEIKDDGDFAFKHYIHWDSDEEGWLDQMFPIPLGIDWLTEFYCFVRSPVITTDLVRFTFGYTDFTSSNQILQVTVANTWEKKVLNPTAGKFMDELKIVHSSVAHDACDLTLITTVFTNPPF